MSTFSCPLCKICKSLKFCIVFIMQVAKFARLGGVNLRKGVSALLNNVIGDELMCGLNMQGGGSTNKAAFERTALYVIMTGRSSTFLTFIRCDGQNCIIDIPCVWQYNILAIMQSPTRVLSVSKCQRQKFLCAWHIVKLNVLILIDEV